MEPLSIMSVILKVAQMIAKAASTARWNKSRCLELAERVRTIGDLLRDSKAANDTAARSRVLGRLKDALSDALKLVESCRDGCWVSRLLAVSKQAGRFDDVERRINNCLLELGIANDARLQMQVIQLAARDHPSTNARARSTEKENNHNAKKKDDGMNGNKSTTAAAAGYGSKPRRARRKESKQMKEKAAAAGPQPPRIGAAGMHRPPPPPCSRHPQHNQDTGAPFHLPYAVHYVEEDPYFCSVM